MEASDRKLFLQIVGQVLIADGALSDAEHGFLEGLNERIGADQAEWEAARHEVSVDSPIEDRVRALSDEARAKIVAAAVEAANSDGESVRSEQGMIERIHRALQ